MLARVLSILCFLVLVIECKSFQGSSAKLRLCNRDRISFLSTPTSFSKPTTNLIQCPPSSLFASTVVSHERKSQFSNQWNGKMRRFFPSVIEVGKRHIFPILVQVFFVAFLGANPAVAAANIVGKKKVKASSSRVSTVQKPKKFKLTKFIMNLFRPNLKEMEKNLKPGDSLELYAFFANLLPTLLVIAALALIGSAGHKYNMEIQMMRMKKEVMREKEYKENMYFDAVEQILKLLKNPKLKLEKKLKLEAELKSIDPDSRIRNFIQNGGPRPDVSKGGQSSGNTDQKQVTSNKKVERPTSSETSELKEREQRYQKLLAQIDKNLQSTFGPTERRKLIDDLRKKFAEWVKKPNDFEQRYEKLKQSMNDKNFWVQYMNRLKK